MRNAGIVGHYISRASRKTPRKKLVLQVDLKEPKAITAIMTQGAKSFFKHLFVTKYTLAFSKDGEHWMPYVGTNKAEHVSVSTC